MSNILTDLAVGGTLWVIASFIANKFTKDKAVSKAKYYTIIAVVIMALIGIKDSFVVPKYNEWKATSSVDDMLKNTEPYITLKTTFPSEYDRIRESLLSSIKANISEQEAKDRLKGVFLGFIMGKLKVSSDEAVVSFVSASMKVSNYFYDKGDTDTVYNYLYNQKDLPMRWWVVLPQEVADAQSNSYKLILLSASQNKTYTVSEAEVNRIMQIVSTDMYTKYGEKFAMLGDAAKHPDKKAEIAEMSIAMYKRILSLPDAERGMVLRYLLTSQ